MSDPIFESAINLMASLSAKKRNEIFTRFDIPKGKPAPALPTGPERILRRGEVAARLSRHVRAVDRLAGLGVLHKVKFPGAKLACGFRESEVVALIEGQA